MIKKNLTKLVGLKKEDFDCFVKTGQIQVQPARLIPTLKTGDEMALTSIFLSTIHLVKEFRDSIFKELKLSRTGRFYFYTEATFPEINKSRLDGLIIVVSKGIITDAVFFEMKNKNNGLELNQIEAYLDICKKLKVEKLVTISNEFVADPSHSPLRIKTPKCIALSHFSWTYLITKGQLLLFKKDILIEDEDQIEIMREVLHYFESPVSGIKGFTQMKSGWKELSESIRAQKPLKTSDEYIEDAVLSWYEEEKDMALLLSRKLGVLVKTPAKNQDSLKKDISRVVKDNYLSGSLIVKDSVSDIKIIAEFERRMVAMSVKVIPPLNKGTIARITWIGNQLENCKKRDEAVFTKIQDYIWVEADIKYANTNLKVKLSELDTLNELSKGKDINAFHIGMIDGFGAGFASNKKFIVLIEQMMLDFYEGIVQHMSNWKRPAPKLEQGSEVI
ncbi:MAG: hypothetical protein WBN63_07685 [Eudoraea sp.]|uniref:hypothetical protein n=1 Tax=Eudoraea sp. TaxID=1979955 RepID=UPI003C787663